MLKFVIVNDNDERILAMGITDTNVDRLKGGKPIMVELAAMKNNEGEPYAKKIDHVVVFHGSTDDDLVTKAKEMFNVEVKIPKEYTDM